MNWGWRTAALKNGFLDATAYRIEFFFEVLSSAFVPAAIQLVIWHALFVLGGNKEIAGMTHKDMIYYTWFSILFTQIRGGNLDFEVAEMIRSGALSNYLIRPVSVVEFVYVRGLAPKLLIAGFGLTCGIIFGLWIGVSPGRILGAMILALFGNIIHYQISIALASIAFYWEEAYSMLMVKNIVVQLLSGELIPLNLFPESAQWIWKSTPFYLYVFGPTQYVLGRWSHTEFLTQLLLGGVWMIIGWALVKLSWGVGLKRYLSLGG